MIVIIYYFKVFLMITNRLANKSSLIYHVSSRPFKFEFFMNQFLSGFGKRRYVMGRYFPEFKELNDKHIKYGTSIDPDLTYRNKIYWTPQFYLQKQLSFEFKQRLKIFKRLKVWTNFDYIALAQLIVVEAIRDTTFEIAENYECKRTNRNHLHGNIPILIYNNDPDNK